MLPQMQRTLSFPFMSSKASRLHSVPNLVTSVFPKCRLGRSGCMMKNTLQKNSGSTLSGRLGEETWTKGEWLIVKPRHGFRGWDSWRSTKGRQGPLCRTRFCLPLSKGSRPVSRQQTISLGLFHLDRAGPSPGQADIKPHFGPAHRSC